MHIIFLSHYFPPEVNAPASRTYENCKRWAALGHHVTVITCVPNMPDGIIYQGYKNHLFQREKISNIEVLRVWTYITPNKGIVRRTVNFITFMLFSMLGLILVKGGDIVIATSPQFFCAIGGYFLSRLKRVPYIMEVRDLWPESIITVEAFTNRKLIRVFEKMELWLYKCAKYVIVVTDSFKKILTRKGISERKVFVVKNGADLELYKPTESDQRIRGELKLQAKFIVAYIGTFGMAHALHLLLKVAKQLQKYPDIVLLLIGSGAMSESLIAAKSKMNLNNVLFLSRQPKERTPYLYAAADVCLVPLKKDRLFMSVIPSKIFEIMAMAKPIIISVDGEARAIVEKARAGIFVEPENEKQLTAAILHLYRNRRKGKLLGRNGRKFVIKNYDRDDLAARYLDIITQQP